MHDVTCITLHKNKTAIQGCKQSDNIYKSTHGHNYKNIEQYHVKI